MAKASTAPDKPVSASKKTKAAKKTVARKQTVAKKKGSSSTGRKSASKSGSAKKKQSLKSVETRHGIDLREISEKLDTASPEDRIRWGLETFPGAIAMSSSFGAQSAVSLHMITRLWPEIPVVLVDTGYLFAQTYQFIEELTERLSLNLRVYSNPVSPAWQEAKYGKLWESGVEGIEKYNQMNKVEPMNRALSELGIDAMFSGLRRQQSRSRSKMPVVVSQRERIKIHPIIDWTDRDVGMYLMEHKLPYHPLWEEGYISIGDWHTTRKLTDGMTEEDTRFFGLKRECGLHEEVDFQI